MLGYFVLTPSLAENMKRSRILEVGELDLVQGVARIENDQILALEQESEPIIQNEALSLAEKRTLIAKMDYNPRLDAILQSSIHTLKNELGGQAYTRLVAWIEAQWRLERQLHDLAASVNRSRSYEIFATRYDSKGAYTVALPDKCLKFANAGNHVCDEDGYVVGQDYTVYLSYKKSTAARVLESGPWNVDDNYWSRASDPQPRRMFRDLALGLPEAQAAYFNGYNGGVDQFGRKVTAPFAIDLARQVSIDIGLQPGVNDWITVSFMWTDGWDAGSSSKEGGSTNSGATQVVVIPIKAATPNADGSVMHTVQAGQTLWDIAAVYEVSLQDILSLNGLAKDALIFPGEKLIVKPATTNSTPLAKPSPLITGTLINQGTATPRSQNTASTASLKSTTTASQMSISPITQPSKSPQIDPTTMDKTGIDPLLAGIIALLVIGSGLVLSGIIFRNRR
jgi:LysM repeat protein